MEPHTKYPTKLHPDNQIANCCTCTMILESMVVDGYGDEICTLLEARVKAILGPNTREKLSRSECTEIGFVR